MMEKPNVRIETLAFELWIIDQITDRVSKRWMKRGIQAGLTNIQSGAVMLRAMSRMSGWLYEKFPDIRESLG